MPEPKRGRPNRGRPRPLAATAAPTPRRGATPTQARLLALRVLERVERAGAYADLALHAALRRSRLAPSDRALATELVYGTLRWRGRLDFWLRPLLQRDFERLEPLVATLLRLGAYQIRFMERVPDGTAVDQTVRCARAVGAERATGLVNAVLRRLAAGRRRRTLPSLEDDPRAHLVHALSLPEWVAERLLEQFGPEEAARLAEAQNVVPPLTVRANPRRGDRAALLEELRERFPEARPCAVAPGGLVLGARGNPGLEPAFLDGRFTVQDEASQLVVALLDPQPGERVLDACAAPGTKTTAVAERVGDAGEVCALDRNARRLGLVGREARRLGLVNVTTREQDATLPLGPLAEGPGFDRVLVDAPCSGLGTLRRNPDLRWRLRPEEPARLAETQRALLRRAAEAVAPGGVLVYSTCTFLPEENEEVVEAFLRETPGFRRVPAAELPEALGPVLDGAGALRCLPHRHGTDGFYAVRLERSA